MLPGPPGLADAIPQPVWTAAPDGTVTYVNPAWSAYTGLTVAEVVGRDWTGMLHPDDVETVQSAIREVASGDAPVELKCRIRGDEGAFRWHLIRLSPLRDAAGERAGWIASATDVEERHQATDAVRRNEERYRALFDSMDQGFCVIEVLFDENGRPVDYLFLEANPAFERHTGLRNALGRTAREMVPDLEEHWFERYGHVAATGEPVRFVSHAAPMDARWFDVFAFRLGEPEQRQVAILFTDFTERKRAAEDEARLAAIVESSHDAIHGRTLDGIVTSWNPAAEELYGYRAEEMLGHDVSILLPPDRAEEFAGIAERLQRGERIPPYETVRMRKDGTLVHVENQLSPIADGTREIIGVAAISRDVSERQAARHQQQAFLEAVSHDLKNPLTTVLAQAQLLKRRIDRGGELDVGALSRAAEAIDAAVERMSSQLDELQDVVRLRSGDPLELRTDPTDLVALARAAAGDASLSGSGHQVTVHAAPDRIVGEWDALRLRRVLDNLLSNAVKYSPNGGEIAIAIVREEDSCGGWAVLTVRDDGVGIPAADLPHIFERYRRGSNVGDRVIGAGIGLAGVRQIVEQHGGTVVAESEEHHGTLLTVRLPLSSTKLATEG